MSAAPLALFDLDHTLLSGDSDILFCRFAVRHRLAPAERLAQNESMEAGYRAGTVDAADFSRFFLGLLAGRSPGFWAPWRARFLAEEVLPRLPPAAHSLVARHREAGHTLVLTTATNRVITELTAAALGIEHLIATEAEQHGAVYTGRPLGTLNMREGKVLRLRAWLAARGIAAEAALAGASFYSDSANDLPLMRAVGRAVAVDPDERLAAHARESGWPVIALERSPAPAA